MDPIPISALSGINALGDDAQSVWQAACGGVHGLGAPPFELPFEAKVGRIQSELPKAPGSTTRQARLCWAALEPLLPAVLSAVQRYGADRVGVVLGTSTGGIAVTERVVRQWHRTQQWGEWHLDRDHAMHAILPLFREQTGLRGPAWIVSNACASSAKAFASAQRAMAAGHADAMVVGGVDSLCELTVRGFESLEVLTRDVPRPFDRDRSGICIGEGAALMLLDRRGDGPATLRGVGESSDAHHMSAPDPQGRGAERAMRAALADAKLGPDALDHVRAHGTGTRQNDVAESAAIARVCGEGMEVTADKGGFGHTLGAAGASSALLAVFSIATGVVPGVIGLADPDPALPVKPLRGMERRDPHHVLVNSLAFGGSNASLVFGGSR